MKHIFCAIALSLILCTIVCAEEEPCDCCAEYKEFYNEWNDNYSGVDRAFSDEDGGSVTEERDNDI